jgi:hypothetical protein
LISGFNPFFIFKKKERIIPFIKNLPHNFWDTLKFRAAKNGLHLSANETKLRSLKDKHRGQRCFVIGNGPSLLISDLQKLHELGEVCFGFNKIYLAFSETDFRPTYYMIEDPLVSKNAKIDFSLFETSIKFFPKDFNDKFKNVANAWFYNLNWNDFFPNRPMFTCNPFNLHWGATVTYTAIQFAIYAGCNPIYLIGVDFFFKEPPKKDSSKNNVLIGSGELNHFHPEYRPAGEKWYAPRLDHQKKAFEAALQYCQGHGIEIVNASRKSRLDIFKKQSFDAIIS